MPIYAYRCDDCGHQLESLQKISEPPLSECPKCGHAALKKQVTAAGFQLKGSGWYQTDFRGKSQTSSSEQKTDAKNSEAPKTADDKSATKTPPCCSGCACHS